MNYLSQLGGQGGNDLHAIATDVERHLSTEDDAALQDAFARIERRPNFFQRLFPDQFTKKYNGMVLKRMDDIFSAKEQLLEIYSEVQLEMARQKGDALLAATGMELQEKLAKFAEEKMQSVSITMKEGRMSFAARMKESYNDMQQYKDIPFLAEQYEASIHEETVGFFDFVNKLLKGFRSTLDRKVSQLVKS